MPTRTRTDRTTLDGMIWNAEFILDRLDSHRVFVDEYYYEDASSSSSSRLQRRQRRPHNHPRSHHHQRSKSSGDVLTMALVVEALSSDDDDDGQKSVVSWSLWPALGTLLPTPLPAYLQGVILLSVVLPPISNYVGRVGTGLAYQRVHHPKKGDDHAQAETGAWFHPPKPCSFTALVSPLVAQKEQQQKMVIDLVLFVCGGASSFGTTTTTTTTNKENQQQQLEVKDGAPFSWWDNLSQPSGLMVVQDKQVLPSTETLRNNNTNKNDVDEDDEDDEAHTLSPSPRHQAGNNITAINMAQAFSLSSEKNQSYPLATREGEDQKAPAVYYYAWHKAELLRDNRLLLKRVVLMEMAPTPNNASTNHDEDDQLVRARLQQVLTRSSHHPAPLENVQIPSSVVPRDDQNKSEQDPSGTLAVVSTASETFKMANEPSPVEEQPNTVQEDARKHHGETAESNQAVVEKDEESIPQALTGSATDMDETTLQTPSLGVTETIKEQGSFLSDDYC